MKRVVSIGLIVVAVLGGLIFLLGSFTIVNAGHVGVVKRLGAVQPLSLEEGFHFKVPLLDSVEEIDIRLRKAENDASAASQDLQVVETQVAVQYSMTPEIMPLVMQRIGNRNIVERTLVDPAILESVKAVTAQYTAEELITRREEVKIGIRAAIEEFLRTTLAQKEVLGAVTLANVAITDFAFSDEFNRAIEEKVKAEQEALKAENEKIRRVTQAEAAAEERTIAADAEAYQIEVESVAKAEAIRREAEALAQNPNLISLRIAESWDGTLPRVTAGDGIPLLNIDSLVD